MNAWMPLLAFVCAVLVRFDLDVRYFILVDCFLPNSAVEVVEMVWSLWGCRFCLFDNGVGLWLTVLILRAVRRPSTENT